jgi:hypothetical protein
MGGVLGAPRFKKFGLKPKAYARLHIAVWPFETVPMHLMLPNEINGLSGRTSALEKQ